MSDSPTFIVLDEMIKKHWVTDDTSEFNQVVEHYRREGRITSKEYRSLMELYFAAMRINENPKRYGRNPTNA